MVSYQRWTQMAFEEARSQGIESNAETSREVVSVAAAVWRDRKPELSAATIQEARLIAGEEIEVGA